MPCNLDGFVRKRLVAITLWVHFFSRCQVKKNVLWLFPEDGDVDRAAAFFRNLLWTKETMCQTTKSEASAFSKLLMRRTKQNDLCKVPACTGRAWLVQIWKDVPSTRPHHEMLVSCVVRWLADPYETQGPRFKRVPCHTWSRSQSQRLGPSNYHSDFSNFQFLLVQPPPFPSLIPAWMSLLAICLSWPPWDLEGVKAACLKVLGEETARLRSSADLETWIISLLFQEVMGLQGQKPKTAKLEWRCCTRNSHWNWSINVGHYFSSLQLCFHLNWNMGVIALLENGCTYIYIYNIYIHIYIYKYVYKHEYKCKY